MKTEIDWSEEVKKWNDISEESERWGWYLIYLMIASIGFLFAVTFLIIKT